MARQGGDASGRDGARQHAGGESAQGSDVVVVIVLNSSNKRSTPDHSLTLFELGLYSLGRQDQLVTLTASPQARKKWPDLPSTMSARLLHHKVNGKEVQILTSMTDQLRFPASDIFDLYSHRWEIELGYREMKQSPLGNRLTLRSRTPEMVCQ